MKRLISIVLGILSLPFWAQENEVLRNQIFLSGAENSNWAWEVEASYMRRVNSWLGAGAGLNLYHQWTGMIYAEGPSIQVAHDMTIAGWRLSDDSRRASGIQFNPFIHLNTPSLFRLFGACVLLYAEPGALMTIFSDRNVEVDYWTGSNYGVGRTFTSNKGDWFFWSTRLGVSLDDDGFSISAGYLASNVDFYAYTRHIQVENVRLGDNLPHKRFNWGVYVNVGYKF